MICDRYYYSGVVYSAAKQNPSLSLAWARAPEVGLPRPDLVLFLDLDEDQARARGGWGAEVYEKAEMQRRVRMLFRNLSSGQADGTSSASRANETDKEGVDARQQQQQQQRVHLPSTNSDGIGTPVVSVATADVTATFEQEKEDLRVIDASASVEEVAEEIWKVVQPRVSAVESGEVGRNIRKVI